MASDKTLAKRIEERRTWNVTWKGADGVWRKTAVNVAQAAAKANASGEIVRVKKQVRS